MTDTAHICAACGGPLPPPLRPNGRKRVYCSQACRQAAYRAKARAALPPRDRQAPPPGSDSSDEEQIAWLAGYLFDAPSDPIDAAVEVIATLRTLAAHARRLAVVGASPPTLAWRHESTANALDALLHDLWTMA